MSALLGSSVVSAFGLGFMVMTQLISFPLHCDCWPSEHHHLPLHRAEEARGNVTQLQTDRYHLPDSLLKCQNSTNVWCFLNSDGLDRGNVPPPMFEHAAAGYKRYEDDRYEKMVIFGGSTKQTSSMNDTWVYTPWSNSWLKLSLQTVPAARSAHTLTTICGTRAILHGGISHNATGWYHFSDTWMFYGATETWHQLFPQSQTILPADGRNYFTAVAMTNRNSTCRCQESVVVFGGETKGGSSFDDRLLELRCVDDSHWLPMYEWRDLKPMGYKGNRPHARQFHQSISAYNKTIMYMNGGIGQIRGYTPAAFPELWMYNILENKWTLLDNYSSPSLWYSEQAMSVTSGVYLEPHTFLMMNSGMLLGYDLVSRRWMHVSSITRSPPYPDRETRMTHGVVVIANQAILYGMFPDPSAQQADSAVWNISVLPKLSNYNELTVVWSANPQARPSPPPLEQASASTALIGHRLYQFAGAVYDDSLNQMSYLSALYSPAAPDVWFLDLQTLQWWQHRANPQRGPPRMIRQCGTAVNNKLFVSFGGFIRTQENFTVFDQTWGFDTVMRNWTRFRNDNLKLVKPSGRLLCSMVSLTNGSAILFGGLESDGVVDRPLNDLWLLSIKDAESYDAIDRTSATWTRLLHSWTSSSPSPRFNHMTVATDTDLIVYGGATS